MLCHVKLCEDDGTDVDASADWTKAISRGGVKLVNNKTYHFFHAVEMNIRRHFSKTSAPTLSAGSKATLVENIATDEDVLLLEHHIGRVGVERVADLATDAYRSVGDSPWIFVC